MVSKLQPFTYIQIENSSALVHITMNRRKQKVNSKNEVENGNEN